MSETKMLFKPIYRFNYNLAHFIDIPSLANNKSPYIIELLKDFPDIVSHKSFIKTQKIIICENEETKSWHYISGDPSPLLIEIIAKNPDKICFQAISTNPNICEIFQLIKYYFPNEKHYYFTEIFPYDYQKMRDKMLNFKEELCQYVFNPKRMQNIANLCNLSLQDLQEMY